MIALDHIVATQERQRIEIAGMSDPLHRYALRILEKQLNEPDAPSPSTTPRTPQVRRAVRFDPNEAPSSYISAAVLPKVRTPLVLHNRNFATASRLESGPFPPARSRGVQRDSVGPHSQNRRRPSD